MATEIAKAIEEGGIGPNEPVVSFCRFTCRSCDEGSDWFRQDDPDAEAWDVIHNEATGHHKFYLWTAMRQTSQMFTFSARKRGRS